MSHYDQNGALADRKWIGEISAGRVGEVWQPEDHQTLVRTLHGVDEVATGLVALAKHEATATGAPAQIPRNPSTEADGRRNLWGLRLSPTVTIDCESSESMLDRI